MYRFNKEILVGSMVFSTILSISAAWSGYEDPGISALVWSVEPVVGEVPQWTTKQENTEFIFKDSTVTTVTGPTQVGFNGKKIKWSLSCPNGLMAAADLGFFTLSKFRTVHFHRWDLSELRGSEFRIESWSQDCLQMVISLKKKGKVSRLLVVLKDMAVMASPLVQLFPLFESKMGNGFKIDLIKDPTKEEYEKIEMCTRGQTGPVIRLDVRVKTAGSKCSLSCGTKKEVFELSCSESNVPKRWALDLGAIFKELIEKDRQNRVKRRSY